MSVVGRAAAAVVNTAVITAVVAIPPWALVRYAGNPFPTAAAELARLDRGAVTLQQTAPLLTILLGTVWLLLLASLAIEASARLRGVAPARWYLLRPVQGLAAALVAGQAATVLAPAVTAAALPHAVPPADRVAATFSTTEQQTTPGSTNPTGLTAAQIMTGSTTFAAAPAAQQSTGRGPVTVVAGDISYSYTVQRGDWMSKIAKVWLGDPDRWPEICELNRHRHFPTVGGTLRDCNLIYPGWDLRLPADAPPPAHATPTPPPAPPPQAGDPHGPTSSPPTIAGPSATVGPHASTSPPAANPAVPIAPAASASPAPSTSAGATASAPRSADRSPDPSTTTPADHDQGIQLADGSWVTWTLAAAITAAAALVWLQRRRRFTIETHDDPPTELPPAVAQLRRAVTADAEVALHDGEAEQAAAVPELAATPPGVIGLIGDGARAAARAALVAALASGGPHHPDRQGKVVIDAATLTALIGPDAATLGPWPRLHITDDIDAALTLIEAALLHRSRILDEHSLSDLDTLRTHAPYEEAMPPILLVTNSPPPPIRMRANISLTLATGLRVSAILLGERTHGTTLNVTADGHTTLSAGQPAEPVPPRLPVLTADAAVQILHTLHEAHTGQPAAASAATPTTPLAASRTTDPVPAPQQEQQTTARTDASATAAGRKARLCVLGTPRIEDITHPGRDLRSKARELAVFLACHPDGASTREIGEYLEPDARLSQADQRVHTNASNLRHVLARTGSADTKTAYVIKTAGRYRLDPATVDVDIWQLRDLLRNATIATGQQRRTLLTQACDRYTAPLADGQHYEWITGHRETVRRWGTEAHMLLADDLLNTDPQAASNLLDKAIGLDRYNEALYQKAMHARHALHDTDGIRTLLHALTKALADLDAEPEEKTTALATKLRTSLEHR